MFRALALLFCLLLSLSAVPAAIRADRAIAEGRLGRSFFEAARAAVAVAAAAGLMVWIAAAA